MLVKGKAKGFTAANYHGKLRRWREAEEERQRSNRKSSGDRLSRVLFSVLSTTGSGAITEALQELSRRARTPPPRVTQLVEQVPSWLLRQAGLSPRAARRGQRTHAGGHLGGKRTAAVMPSWWYKGAPARGGTALRGGVAVCYHLNYFSWGKAWKSFVAGRQRDHQRGGSRKARLARESTATFACPETRTRGQVARSVISSWQPWVEHCVCSEREVLRSGNQK